MDFSMPKIIVMVFASIVGLAYFRYGKKQADISMIIAGIGLMTYSYVVESLWGNILVGAAIAAAPFIMKRFA